MKNFSRSIRFFGLLGASAALFAMLPAAAQEPPAARDRGWYLGYGLGVGDYSFDAADFNTNIVARTLGISGSSGDTSGSGVASKLYGGYNFNRYFGLEAALAAADAVDIAYTNRTTGAQRAKTEFSASAFTLAGVGRYEFDSGFLVMAKAGVAFTNAVSDYSIALPGGVLRTDDPSSSKTNFYWGLSAGYKFNPRWVLLLDYDNFGTVGDADTTGRAELQSLMASVQYRF
jgi:opacity protein-like surface antigen